METKKKLLIGLLCLSLAGTPVKAADAVVVFPIIGLINEAIKKVILAIDLRIQRLQNKTIWLQNAQKKIENALSKLKLNEISSWTRQQRDLYREYYEELMKVKSIITYYQRIRDISQKQVRMVKEYEKAWKLIQKDVHFNAAELGYMHNVYSGMLQDSADNIDQIVIILNSFATQMSDAKRLEIINAAADRIDANYSDLTLFTRQNIALSLQRAKTQQEVHAMKLFYDLPK